MRPVGLVILAAGASTRLGSPKQLLSYDGRTLLRLAAETAQASPCRPVIVVLGANAARMKEELTGLAVQIIDNPAWEQGMGSSLRVGLNTLLQAAPEVEAALFMLCDQPLLSPPVLEKLVSAFVNAGSRIVACEYGGTTGVPALFARALFPQLLSLADAQGAKKLLRRHAAEVLSVSFPEGAIDIDTPTDYQNLQAASNIQTNIPKTPRSVLRK